MISPLATDTALVLALFSISLVYRDVNIVGQWRSRMLPYTSSSSKFSDIFQDVSVFMQNWEKHWRAKLFLALTNKNRFVHLRLTISNNNYRYIPLLSFVFKKVNNSFPTLKIDGLATVANVLWPTFGHNYYDC